MRRSSKIIGVIGGASALLGSFVIVPLLQDPEYVELEAALEGYVRAAGAEVIVQNPVFWFVMTVVSFLSLYFSFLIFFVICRLITTRIGAKLWAGFSALMGAIVASAYVSTAEWFGVGIPGRLLLIAAMTLIGFVTGALMSATAGAIARDGKKTTDASGASSTAEGEE
ncbi:MAG: hypothetical protein OXG84_08305 [Chloroflexi bacterium]|nr:hypothetical protein [Chloroflexota bacterium]